MRITPDMLVKLYRLPLLEEAIEPLGEKEIVVRRAFPVEKRAVSKWVGEHFTDNWACEAENSFAANPPNIHIAVRGETILGFACYETTFRNYFGPTGVDESERRTGIGRALLLSGLYVLRDMGYRYAIIGYAGVPDYYEKAIGAVAIDNDPRSGSYGGMIV